MLDLYSLNYFTYLSGQFFLGAAAGIYWPSVELAIPSNLSINFIGGQDFEKLERARKLKLSLIHI